MAEPHEAVRATAKRLGLSAMADELGQRVACQGCPAARFIGATRADGMPGVRCAIEHTTLTLGSDPKTILRWCSQPAAADRKLNGYVQCPTWQYEKMLLAMGHHSLGDEARLDELSYRQWREDVTGSPYGDLSSFEEAASAARDTIESWQEQHAERQGQ